MLRYDSYSTTQIVDTLKDIEPDYLWQMMLINDPTKSNELISVKAEYNVNYVRKWDLSDHFGNLNVAFLARIPHG